VRDGFVDSSALSSRDCSVVDYVNAAPATIARSRDATLAVWVDLARIINYLALAFKKGDLAGNEFKDLVCVPLAILRIRALHENKDS